MAQMKRSEDRAAPGLPETGWFECYLEGRTILPRAYEFIFNW